MVSSHFVLNLVSFYILSSDVFFYYLEGSTEMSDKERKKSSYTEGPAGKKSKAISNFPHAARKSKN